MKILRETGSNRIFTIMVGPKNRASMVSIPQEGDPNKREVPLEISDPIGVVQRVYRIKFSLIAWLQLTEQMYQGLRQAGWKPKEASQILPRGGCNDCL